ncbi:MAG: Lrp/AsnC family transcriptional regulator [Alphaproteobacteria bacterium]|nr:Lrp/AsnC family transcriptional regulator [Alphaproteobacteria bacterium]
MPALPPLARRLIDRYQHDLPDTPRPFAAMARACDCTEADVIDTLDRLVHDGVLARVGAVVKPGTVAASTLAAMSVPEERLDEVAALVSSYREVNHNYEREHALNLWFVLSAPDRPRLDAMLAAIRQRTGLDVIEFPLERAYHLDLGFPIRWT